ncbi:MAG: LysR family transcriptional regulator [Alphaproteobacteria bacterium]|nr:LysR family transcriptional regulator [Alphaproteobacteria bacterium]
MDWDRLRIFHIVAEAKNLTHAGYSLNLSQSAVSRQISALEESLSVPLFQRHARGLVLTAEGESLLKVTRGIYTQISTMTSQLTDNYSSLKGNLKISTSVAMGSVWLAPRLHRFFQLCPDLNLEIVLTDEEVDFSTREADIAIRLGHPEADQNLISEKLFSFSLKLYGSPEYLAQHGTPQKPEDLDKHRLIVFGGYTRAPVENVNWILGVGAKAGTIRNPFLIINNAYGILQCVKNGLGLACLPEFIARDNPELICLFPKLKCPTVDAYLVYPKSFAGSKKLHVFRDFIKTEMVLS